MAVKVTTMNKLDVAIAEVRGSYVGGEETDELKGAARELLEMGNRRLLLDLSGASYFNSSGLGAVVSIHSMYRKAGGRVVLCGLDRGVKNVFILTSLTRVIEVEESRAAGLARLEEAVPNPLPIPIV